MTKTTSLDLNAGVFAAEASTTNPIVRARMGLAALLTGITIAIGISLGLAFGPIAIVLFALPLPVPLVLLWLSSDVLRADEQQAVGSKR